MRRAKSSSLANAVTVILILPAILLVGPFVLVCWLMRSFWGLLLNVAVWLTWIPKGKRMLLINSNSPVGGKHFHREMVAPLQDEAAVLNWSERKQWLRWRRAVQCFRHFRGETCFNPMVIVFRPWRRPKIFRFYEAYRDAKHGHMSELHGMQDELFRFLGKTSNAYSEGNEL
jgi:hypothetical protein